MKILANFGDYLHNEDRKKLNTYGGIGYYRIVKPASQIKGHDVKVIGKEITHYDSFEEQWDSVFKNHDVYWTNYFADPRAGAAIFFNRDKYKKKVWIDIDDNYLDVPESNLEHNKFKPGTQDRAFLSTILSFADALTVSTEPLKERLHSHILKVHGIDKPVYVIPNFNDYKDWEFPIADKHKDKIVLGYSGSNSHQDDLKMVMPSIAKIMKKYKHVHFELIGAISKDKVIEYFGGAGMDDDCLNRTRLLPATSIFKDYPQYLLSQKWDICIAPLVDTAFTRCKSHIKWLEYSMAKFPTVASRVYPYFMELNGRQTIEDGVTGFLCKPNEWVDKLERLIHNPELRKEIGENAYNYVKKEWQYADSSINQVVEEMLK